MNIAELLTAAGVPCRLSRFPQPPAGTYAVYTDSQQVDGADGMMGGTYMVLHGITIELYAPRPDPAAEAAVEGVLAELGRPWEKQEAYWLQDVQRYQTVYDFNYTEKQRRA